MYQGLDGSDGSDGELYKEKRTVTAACPEQGSAVTVGRANVCKKRFAVTVEGGNMREKDIVAAILRLLKQTPNCFCWKEHGGMYGMAGIPDIIACVNGRFVAFEVKVPGGKLTKLQEIALAKIRAAGGQAHRVSSAQEVAEILKSLEECAL